MNINLKVKMKDAVRTFKRNADGADKETVGWLSDNYYILERCAMQAAEECRHAQRLLKGSDLLPGLFMRCRELCEKGVLPDEDKITEFFGKSGLGGIAAGYLPLAITCALIDIAAEGVKAKSKSGSKLLANSVTSLRRMSETDFDFITEKLCTVEGVLLSDPAGIYPSMDNESKRRYRYMIARKALNQGKSEKEIAADALEKAKKKAEHIGKYIVGIPKTRRGYLFLIMEIVMPLAVSVAASILMQKPLMAPFLFFPMWEILRYPIESASMKGVTPQRFFRLSSDDESVMNAHALITVSTIMPPADKITELEKHLEQICLSNCMGNIRVCCLADFKGAGTPRKPEDKTMIKAAEEAIDRLNRKHGGGFMIAVRPRVYSKTQNEFIGRERKRGALTELIKAIKGNPKGFLILHGDTEHLTEVKYLIALDADTQLVFDSARELIAIAEHPLNRPVICNGRVVDGYGILVPKTENRLESGKTSFFAKIMAGDTGITAYDSLSCERYQDLFGEGIFSGKGLIDVEAYHELIDGGLPKETILSHDIVESGYLRAGFVPDVQITESFPQSTEAFYRRLHRWIRGDWQNIGFVFGRNSLDFISKYKMFDNLRRSMTSTLCLIALAVSLFIQGDAGVFLALTALFALSARNLFAGINALMNSGFSAISRLYYSKALPSALSSFVRAFISVAYSARESYVCTHAAIAALWRLLVSRKNLLEWTTAAQSESAKSASGLLISCIPAAVTGVLLLSGLPIHRLIGLVVLSDIPIAFFSGARIKRKTKKITEKQRETMLSYASAMWGFFDDLCGKSNNFLPPDNIQFSPVRAVAARTSPTNIGLMLVSFLAARDFGFITSRELYMRLNLSLGTVEKLEKYEGNLLNWYDTETLEPLNPRFVSTVDSGNFLCCLTALKEGLKEYLWECSSLENIIKRTEMIIDKTNLKPLYNERRKLFHIGVSPDDGRKSQSYYDLYMCEARMTAYFAVARRAVPKKHWGAMGRILVGQGRYTGLASWTGTMFEYFMPNLFIPAPAGSLSSESLYFCLHCQRKKAGKKPFGVSESGFYAFDGNLNYQYKAHGVQKLGLRRELDRENVVSPYSSFLTLTTAPQISIKNLSRLEKMGMTDKYGFFEAADFTKGRNSGGFSVVRSYMAHHVGMSFLSVANLLKNECMQRRFMSDVFMQGAKSLLEENIQTGASLFKDIRTEEIRHVREKTQGKNIVSHSPSPFSPEATIFSNGRMTTCITDCGTGVTLFDGIDVTVNSGDLLQRPQGVFAVFTTENERIPFVNAIDMNSSAKFKAEFFKNKSEHTAQCGNILLKMRTELLRHHNCEIRRFTVENTGHRDTLKGKLTVYFDPCLEKRTAYSAHPAFSKLFLTDEWDEENKCFLFSRRARDSAVPCAIAAGFIQETEFKHESDREKVLKTPLGVFSIGEKTDFIGCRGNPDCCCAFSVDIELRAKEKKTMCFALAAEDSKEQALNTFLTVRTKKDSLKAENPFYSEPLHSAVSNLVLPKLLYPKRGLSETKLGVACNFERQDLWSFGISGDLPVVLVKVSDEESVGSVLPYIRLNKVLRSCGVQSDLVIAYRKEEGYTSPVTAAVRKMLLKEDCSLMAGVRGGVHLADLSCHSYEQLCALEANAVFIAETNKIYENRIKTAFRPLKIECMQNCKKAEKNSNVVKSYNFTDSKITVNKEPAIVDIPWNMVFANKSFGTMVSDKSLGFTWALNSRENKLTPWYNDTMTDNRGEILFMKYNGVLYDIASLGKAEFTPQKASWSAEICGVKIRVEITVPKRGTVKKCLVEILNDSGSVRDFDLLYYTLPVLGVNRESSGVFFAEKNECGAVIHNSFSDIPGFFALLCEGKADYICFSVKELFEGHFISDSDTVSADCCMTVGKKISLAAGGKTAIKFYLSWGATEKAAMKMPCVADYSEELLNPMKINTPDDKLNLFFNSFLYSQIKQSRFYGRTGFYQCSGAYGFRDQLQDCLAFIDFEPNLTLTHIYRCAAVQFLKGDVLHWWHVIVNKKQIIRGVRTMCSDDMLWLPYACAVFYQKTGDLSFFETKIPYIEGPELNEGERERYIFPERTAFKETLLDHCIRAVDFSLKFGKNGLPLIGSCDWNDGFSNIGDSEGGESVWLAMFQKIILEEMSKICSEFGMKDKSDEYLSVAQSISETVEKKAWSGDRYIRAILRNGEILGSKKDFIDILPQAFAVFADLGENDRADTALETALKRLYDKQTGVVRLLSPPFTENDRENVGYIASYPSGIRENSGQYTHASVWLAAALIRQGKVDEGKRLISSINPLNYYCDEKRAAKYRGEPFVLAGDVSYGDGITGRAGWTHFTGSAAWFYRIVIDNIPMLGGTESEKTINLVWSNCKASNLNKQAENSKIITKQKNNNAKH